MSRFTRCSLLVFIYFFSISLAQASGTDESVVTNLSIKTGTSFNLSPLITLEKEKLRYIVSRGETLTDIALSALKKAKLKISSSSIMKTAQKIASYNGITNPDFIITGQIIDLSIISQHDAPYATQNEMHLSEKTKSTSQRNKLYSSSKPFDITADMYNYNFPENIHSSRKLKTDVFDELNSSNLVKENPATSRILFFGAVAQIKINSTLGVSSFLKRTKNKQYDLTKSKKNKIFVLGNKNQNKTNLIIHNVKIKLPADKSTNSSKEIQTANKSDKISSNKDEILEQQKISEFKNNLEIKSTVVNDNFVKSQQSYLNTPKVSDPKKELDALVKDLVEKADKPSQLPKFKRFKEIISIPFGSTPLFLQTLESLKIAEEKKNIAFSKFLPRVTSSVGGGIKSGGYNNDSSSQSKSFTISQLVYDFGVTSRQYKVTEKEELSSQYKIDQQRTDLLFEIISAFFEVYRAETLLKLSQGFVETRSEFLESVKTRQRLGGSSNADVIRAETKLSEALDKIPTEVQNLKNSKAVFTEYFDTNPSIKTQLHQVPKIESVIFDLSNENIDKNFKIAEVANQIKAAELNYEAEKRSRFGKFGLQAGYQNTDTNLNTPQEQSSILLTYQIDVFSGFESKAKISQANLKVNALRYEMERMRKELIRELSQSENSFEAQSALVLSRVALVKGAELSNQVNRELFELNKTSINDLFRSQEEFLNSAKNLVDATVEKNLSFYRLAAKFGTLLNLFELRT